MKEINGVKMSALIATVLFVGSLFWLLNVRSMNDSLTEGINSEKLKSEALLSEKLLFEKDIARLRENLSDLQKENAGLDKVCAETNDKLKQMENGYSALKRQNASLTEIKKQHKKLLALNDELTRELAGLRSSNTLLVRENTDLKRSLTALEQKNFQLIEELNSSSLASLDQTQIQAVRGKVQKVTVRARQTKMLVANFIVRGTMKDLRFNVIEPNGTVMSDAEGAVAVHVLNENEIYTASCLKKRSAIPPQSVQMEFKPIRKLKSGVYRIEIFSDSLYLGSLKTRLR